VRALRVVCRREHPKRKEEETEQQDRHGKKKLYLISRVFCAIQAQSVAMVLRLCSITASEQSLCLWPRMYVRLCV
jgi:hypothetical protein